MSIYKKLNSISRRGVYYDLTKSPYVYTDDLGKTYSFSSQKKLDIFTRKVKEETDKFCEEIHNLKELGYEIPETFSKNLQKIPELIYNRTTYK